MHFTCGWTGVISLRWGDSKGSYSEDGLYGADAVVSGAPVATAVVEAFLQDVLVTWEVHMRVGHPPEHETEAERKQGSVKQTDRGVRRRFRVEVRTYAPLSTWMDRVLMPNPNSSTSGTASVTSKVRSSSSCFSSSGIPYNTSIGSDRSWGADSLYFPSQWGLMINCTKLQNVVQT